MNTKIFKTAIATVMVIGVVAACGGNTEPVETPVASPTVTETETPKPVETETPEP